MFVRTLAAVVLSQTFLLPPVLSQAVGGEFDGLSVNEATAKLLLMPAEKRDETLRLLLKSGEHGQRGLAADVIKSIYALPLLDELKAAETREAGHKRVQKRMQDAIKTLTLYSPIAVKELENAAPTAGSLNAITGRTGMEGLFTPAAVDVLVVQDNGKPFGDCSTQAFSDDYGILVPFGEFKKTDASGHATFDIFPGKWTFFAFGHSKGSALYLCSPGVEVTDGDTVTLRPTSRMTVDFIAEGGTPLDVDEVLMVDAAFSDFLPPAPLGPSDHGKFQVWTAGERPLDITAARQPRGEPGILLHAGRQTPREDMQMSARKQDCAEFVFEASPDPPKISNAQITLAPRCLSKTRIPFTGDLPMRVIASAGTTEVSYSYQTEDGYSLDFAPRRCDLPKGSSKTVKLGGPYRCSDFHQFYKNYAREKNKLAYYLFVRDSNDHLLRQCSKTAGRRRAVALPLKVKLDGNVIFDSSSARPTRQQFAGVPCSIPDAESLERLQYEVDLPFTPGKTYAFKGHGADFTKGSEHFNLEMPNELAYNADNWLEGSELLFDGYCDLLGYTPKWTASGTGIRFRCKMPPGVGAFASGGGVSFTIASGETMTHPRRILDVPLRHELLHKFAFSHRDYMAINCQEVAVRMYEDNPAPRFRKRRSEHLEMLKCMRGEAVVKPDAVIPQILLARYGHDLFNDYKQKGCLKRDLLLAQGLSEMETDCAIFAFYGGDDVIDIFRATGIPFDESNLKKGLALLSGDGTEAAAEVSKTPRGPNPQGMAGRAYNRAKNLFEQGKVNEALKLMKTAAAHAEQIPNHRQRAALFCRMGETLFQNGKEEESYEMLKACQRAAARVDYAYLTTARRMCLDVLRGKLIMRFPT